MKDLFQKKPFVIGMVHFGSLRRPRSKEEQKVLFTCAKQDTETLIRGGVDGIMFENMYDYPHTEKLDQKRRAQFQELVEACVQKTDIPFGLSVLWNDYEGAFQIAKATGASWVRVPVFVDSVKTQFGVFRANPAAVIAARKHANVEQVRILADIQVKHAEMLEPQSIAASAEAAEQAGANGVIVTGTWTGEAAEQADAKEVARATTLPVFIGSGITAQNIQSYAPYSTGVIVGTALKGVGIRPSNEERLRTPEEARIDEESVRKLVQKAA